jgi:hypothetical protein
LSFDKSKDPPLVCSLSDTRKTENKEKKKETKKDRKKKKKRSVKCSYAARHPYVIMNNSKHKVHNEYVINMH